MEAELPTKVKSFHSANKGAKFSVIENDMPKPGPGEVLVKIAYSTVNPSDLESIAGRYPSGCDPEDYIPGNEGCGTVVEVGDKVTLAKGAKVALSQNKDSKLGRCWSQYAIIKEYMCIELPKDFDLKFAACPIVNPLTAHLMVHNSKVAGYNAIVLTAANSALCKMIIRVAKSNGLKTISIVRKDDQIKGLKDLGSDAVLNSTAADFKDQYKKAVADLQAGAIFDAVGGEFCVELLRGLPPGGVLYVYGALQDPVLKNVTVDLLIFQGKEIKGFYLSAQIMKYKGLKGIPGIEKLPELLKGDCITDFNKEVGLNELEAAIAEYKKDMSAGKILINPHKH